MCSQHLFSRAPSSSAFDQLRQKAFGEIESLSEERQLNTEVTALVEYFVTKYIPEVPKFSSEDITASSHERRITVYDHWDKRPIDVPGEAYDFEIPFQGDPAVLELRPNTWDTSPPFAYVTGQVIKFTIADRSLNSEQVKQRLDSTVNEIETYLRWHEETWTKYREQLTPEVLQRIEMRRERILRQKGTAAKLVGLGIKLKEKSGDTRTFVPPVVKQKIVPQLPPMKKASPPEPTLDQKQYETILGLIRGAGRSIEQSSSRTRNLDEESLRDMFLVPLNAHFGSATGETFNFSGKTDILIRHEGGNLFVGEFKIWSGEKNFLSTIDQLLGYLTWRDTKAAIVIFNRNAGFSSVLGKLRATALIHPSYIKGPTNLDETSDAYVFCLPRDRERHAQLAILAFDLGQPSK